MGASDYYNTGGGSLEFTPIENGALGTKVPFGQTENIAFSTEIEELKHDNTENAVTYEDIAILKKVTGTLNIDTLEISPLMLSRAFLGDNNSVTVAENAIATTASKGFVTATALDTAYAIGVKRLDVSTIVVKDDTDTTTYVLDTDYTLSTVNEVTSITALSTGDITVGDVLHITANNATYVDVSIETFTKTKLEGVLTFTGKPANGVAYTYTFHRVSLLASGDFSLKSSDEFSTLSFEGTMLSSELVTGEGLSKLLTVTGIE